MADARFEINAAIEMLRADADHRIAGLKGEAERLEEHLLEAFAGRERATIDPNRADIVHVFEVNTMRGDIPAGMQLEVMAYGNRLGYSLVAPPIMKGRYRAVLMLTRIDDEAPRR